MLNLGLLHLAVECLRWHYAWGGLLGFAVSNGLGFQLNRALTFRGRGRGGRYMFVMSCSALFYMAAVSVLVDVAHVPYMPAAVFMTGVMSVVNFMAHRRWSFVEG